MGELAKADSSIGACEEGAPDHLFACCVSAEDRSLGVTTRLHDDYSAVRSLVFVEPDESEEQTDHLEVVVQALSSKGNVEVLHKDSSDPARVARLLRPHLHQMTTEGKGALTVDITSFEKSEILLLLKLFDELDFSGKVRLAYTEPENYLTHNIRPRGLRKVSIAPTFKASYKSQQGVTLVMFLGYEGNRALATWENIEPNDTIAVIARPAYHKEWEGRTEKRNSALLSALSNEKIRYVDSRDPRSTYDLLAELTSGSSSRETNWHVAPLGTKLQTIGIYRFIAENPDLISVVDSQTYSATKEEYRSIGVGATWLIEN